MKKYFIGFIVGALLMISTSAFAAVGDKVEAVFSSYIFKVNGQEKTLNADPLTYQGTTYLPVRVVANILGYDVVYKADSLSIEFNKPLYDPLPTVEPNPTTTAPTGEPTATKGSTEPSSSPEPSPSPTASPEPSPSPSPVVVDNTAACKQIRDSYTLQIFNIENSNTMGAAWKITQLQNSRDAELLAAGC